MRHREFEITYTDLRGAEPVERRKQFDTEPAYEKALSQLSGAAGGHTVTKTRSEVFIYPQEEGSLFESEFLD